MLGRVCPSRVITTRAVVKDRRPPQAARASPALVLDREHDVVGLIGQSKPAPLFSFFFYSRATSPVSFAMSLAMERSRGFRWLPSSVNPRCRHRHRYLSGYVRQCKQLSPSHCVSRDLPAFRSS